jgi:dihydrofolate reductase
MAGIGSLLIGKRTFTGDDPNEGTDAEGAFGGQWQGPSIVLTHETAPPDLPADVTYANDLTTAVEVAKAAEGGRYVNVLGADVAAQCLEAGVLDEVLVFIAPVLLGDGVRLFDHPGGTNVALEPLDPTDWGPTRLWFRVLEN